MEIDSTHIKNRIIAIRIFNNNGSAGKLLYLLNPYTIVEIFNNRGSAG